MFSVVLPVPCLIMGSSSSLADGEVCRWYRRVLSVLCPARAVFPVCLENAERLRHPLKPRLIPGNSLFPLLQRLQTNRHCSLNGYVRLLKQHQLENKIVGNQRQIFVTLVSILCSAKFQPLVSLWHTEGTNHFCHLVVSCIAAFMFFFVCVLFSFLNSSAEEEVCGNSRQRQNRHGRDIGAAVQGSLEKRMEELEKVRPLDTWIPILNTDLFADVFRHSCLYKSHTATGIHWSIWLYIHWNYIHVIDFYDQFSTWR